MAEKSGANRITRSTLEKHLTKVDESMKCIDKGAGFAQSVSLFNVVKGIGSSQEMMPPEVSGTLENIRTGFALYYEMYAMLEGRVKELNSSIPEPEKKAFLSAYSVFAASAYMESRLGLMIGDKTPLEFEDEKAKKVFTTLKYDISKDEVVNGWLWRLYGSIDIGRKAEPKVIDKSIDLPRMLYPIFKKTKENALEGKTGFNPKLVDLVKDAQFVIEDKDEKQEMTITGFESGYKKEDKAKVEFVPVLPHQVAGNTRAKTEMLRDMDRMALYDLMVKRNPIMEVGGLSWSVLYDGLPGTGKSTLFRMGLSRLDMRCKQISEFLKMKNLPGLKWTQLNVDQGVKNEYYGKTGQNVLEKINQLKRDDGIYILTMDDIDLLVGDRGANNGGADKDILNVLMQAADGINTIIRGNAQWWAATNDATAMDPALRQRFVARYPVDGPEEWYDFADIFSDKLKGWISNGIIEVPAGKDYTPYKMREGQTGYEKVDEKSDEGLFGAIKGFMSKVSGSKVTLRDIGEFCREKKDKNPRFTGRAANAVAEALKKRINDYDIPEDWYTNPDAFFNKSYDDRVTMLRALSKKVTGNMIIEEIERYASSEQRYADDKFESDVKRRLHDKRVDMETAKRFAPELLAFKAEMEK